jgi:hypothetical protein
MRHRPSDPHVTLLRRLPRAAARSVTVLAELRALPAATVLVVALGFGTSAVLAVARMGRPSDEAAGSAVLSGQPAPSATRDRERSEASGRSDERSGTHVATHRHTATSRWRIRRTTPHAGADAPPPAQRPRTHASSSRSPRSAGRSTKASEAPRAPDDTPPHTSVRARFPAGDVAVFSFRADEPASYSCSRDGGPYAPCDSPWHVARVHPGWHTFAVRATDREGNVEPHATEVRWHANAASSTHHGQRRP